ncbi:MAG: hypothetical protein ACTSO7_18835, partial [Candidatus Heimdallarchaeota archaeon]
MPKKEKLASVLFLVIIIFQSNLLPVQAGGRFPFISRDEGYVHQIINDEYFDAVLLDNETHLNSIDVVKLDNDESASKLRLKLSGEPNLSSK